MSSPDRERTRRLAAWFLGPKAENAELEEKMILHILQDYFHWRRNYFPSDEILVTQSLRRESMSWNDDLFQQISEMLAGFRRHFPVYSPRYNAHMTADQTIPSILGYFAGMLYNPNNVTPEAAPVTVQWELDVGADILRMLGFEPPPKHPGPTGVKTEFGWAHVTSGGTIANLEALWAARNIRYFPLAVRDACIRHGIELTLRLPNEPDAPRAIDTIDSRACLGIKPNQAIYLYGRFADAVRRHYQLDRAQAGKKAYQLLADSQYSIAHHGTRASYAEVPPAVFVAGTRHYSFGKIADLLGVGRANIILVDVDSMFRIDVDDLRGKIAKAQSDGMLPLAVIAVAGTTEEGAVDPVHRIHALREELEQRDGQSFWLHTDAAWGGYLRSLFITPESAAEDVGDFVSRDLTIRRGTNYEKTLTLRWGYSEVTSAFQAFPLADSITVDPHKLGYIPYPCGVVAFRNDLVRQFLTEEAPYISEASADEVRAHHHHPPASVGPFIVEGSKPGAAVAACWLSHRLIPPDRTGYGEIIRASLLAARELYERLVHWDVSCRANGPEPAFRFVPITEMPPDMNVVCFLAVEKNNPTLTRTNALNRWLYERFTIDAEHGDEHYSYSQPFFLSHTEIAPPAYSTEAMATLLARAGLNAADFGAEGLFLLRATVMSHYHVMAAETGHKQALLADFMEVLAQKVDAGIAALEPHPDTSPWDETPPIKSGDATLWD
ncbi:MAG: pyridoxal-dependent decarboxylase [Bryobacteraceae bacterium]